LKTKLLVILLDSFDMRYIGNKEKTPNIYRIGTPSSINISYSTPCISGKGYYWFYTGEYKEIGNWKNFIKEVSVKDIYFWNKMKTTLGILGFVLTREAISPNVKFLLSIIPEYKLVHPNSLIEELNLNINEPYDSIKSGMHKEENITNYIFSMHNNYKSIINHFKSVDSLLISYNLDFYSEIFKGAKLLDKTAWVDSLIGEILNMVETENIIAFSEHGAHHYKEGVFLSTYPNLKVKEYDKIPNLIKTKIENL